MLFGNPVRGRVYTRFGHRFYRSQRYGCTGFSWEPRLGTCAHFHRGIDISHGDGACGRDVVAAAAGTVLFAGTLNDGTHVVTIRHAGGWATGYGHCRPIVRTGQRVAKGQHVGDMDQSGPATGCHTHFAVKKDFPSGGDVNDFWLDDPKYGKSGNQPALAHGTGKGTWVDPWPQLEQNVTVRPQDVPDIRIRTAPDLDASTIYAETEADGRIHRKSDGADLGATSTWRDWGGTFTGDSYPTPSGGTSNRWEKLALDGRWLYVASAYAQRSAS